MGVLNVRLPGLEVGVGPLPLPEAGATCVGICDTLLCTAPQPGQNREPSCIGLEHWGQVIMAAS